MHGILHDALAAVCREFPLREKIVVAPSLAIGHQIGDAVAKGGTPWINLRFETVRTLADAVAAFDIARRGWTVLSRAQALSLIERACDRVLDASSYFAPLSGQPGLHRAVQRSLDELRHAHIDGTVMARSSFEDARKGRDLVRILAAYEEELERGHYIDRLGVLEHAIASLESGTNVHRPWARNALWMLLEDVELTSREARLVELASGGSPTVLQESAAAVRSHRLEFTRAVGEENEIRAAFRAILEHRETADDAEIVYSTRDPYLPLAFELAAEHELPCTFAEGIPAHFTHPGQAALAFLRWVGEGWQATELRRVVGGRKARVLRAAAIGWGRDRYLPRIDALIVDRRHALEIEENESRSNAIRAFLEDAQEARTVVETLLQITEPIAADESIDAGAAARATATFVKSVTVRNEIEVMAREALGRVFAELAVVGTGAASAARRSEITSRLGDAVRNLHVAASNPRPEHLHVAPVRAGGWSSRARMFVVGLDEQRHPCSSIQDPILLDVERQSMGMPIVGDRPEKATEQFARLLRRSAARRVTLSWPSVRLRDRRAQWASSTILSAFRQSTGDGDASYETLLQHAEETRFVTSTPLNASEWWLSRRFIDRDREVERALLTVYPALAAGRLAEAERDSPDITAYDGRITAAPEVLDPRLNGRTYSASQLEKMASCPFRYFLERVLRVTPLEELVLNPDTWLEARESGSMLHTVLQRAMDELTASGTRASLAFLPRMEEIAATVLAETRSNVPPPNEGAFQRRQRELLRSCEVFLRSEEQAPAEVVPRHFEFPFENFALPLGSRTLTLRGFIDRIDHDGLRDEWHVWDYKSGLSRDFEGGWQLLRGTKMQHALYARAAAATLGGRVTKSGYVFPTPKGRGARIEHTCSDVDLERALNLLSDVVASGWFPHADICRWCEFAEVCGGNERASERTATKLAANPEHPAVRAWLELQRIR